MSSGPSAQTRPPVSDSLISIVVPIYDESGVLVEICQRLRAAMASCRTTFEIIFVNDGSRDGSAELLDRLAQQHHEVRVLHLTRNFGHQAALQAGLTHASGDAVVIMDADLQDPPEAIGKLLEAWQTGYDVVYAIRVRRKEWFAKRALFSGFHRLLSSISNTPIPADAGNFGLIDARVARSLLALPERDRYLPGLRSWVGFKQIGVPIERAARYDDRPRVSCRGLFRLATTAVFSFSSLPLTVFSWLGFLAFAMFLAVSGYSLYCRLFTDLAIPGWTSQLVAMSFFAALNALGISMLGQYVVRIYDQVRNRPLYLVDRATNIAAQSEIEHSANAPAISVDTDSSELVDMRNLDPLKLEFGTRWDDAYQHLLDQANDLLSLKAMTRADSEEFARGRKESERASRDMTTRLATDLNEEPPQVLKLSDAKLDR